MALALAALAVFPPFVRGSEDAHLQDLAARSYAADNGVTDKRATECLEIQERSSEIHKDVSAIVGPGRFGGVWFEDCTVNLGVVGGSTQAETDRLVEVLRKRGLMGDAKSVSVSYSENELKTKQAEVDSTLERLHEARQIATSLDLSKNEVLIRVARDVVGQERTAVETTAAPRSVDLVDVHADEILARPQTICSGTAATGPTEPGSVYCDRPFHGGTRLAYTTQDSGCSAAFSGTGRTGNYGPFVITAGHCTAGFDGQWWSRTITGPTWGSLWKRYQWNYGLGDAGSVLVAPVGTTAYWSGPPAPSGYVVVAMPGYRNNDYPVRQEVPNYFGYTVCIASGIMLTSGDYAACGTIDAVNYTAD